MGVAPAPPVEEEGVDSGDLDGASEGLVGEEGGVRNAPTRLSAEPTTAFGKELARSLPPISGGPGKPGTHATEQDKAETEALSPNSDVSKPRGKNGTNDPSRRSGDEEKNGINVEAAASTQPDASHGRTGSDKIKKSQDAVKSNGETRPTTTAHGDHVDTSQSHSHTRQRRRRRRRRRSKWNTLLLRASWLRQYAPVHWTDWVLGYRETPYHRATVQLAVRALDGDISHAKMESEMFLLLQLPPPVPKMTAASSPTTVSHGKTLPRGMYRHGPVSRMSLTEDVAIMAASYQVSTPGEWVNDEPGTPGIESGYG